MVTRVHIIQPACGPHAAPDPPPATNAAAAYISACLAAVSVTPPPSRAATRRLSPHARHRSDPASPLAHLLVRLAVKSGPSQLGRAQPQVKKALALGVEEQVRLAVDLGQPHAMPRVDLEAAEAAHLGLQNHGDARRKRVPRRQGKRRREGKKESPKSENEGGGGSLARGADFAFRN